MQGTKFIKVTSDSKLRKDEWINSRLDDLATSRTRRVNAVLPESADRNRIISSGLRLTDQALRTHSIISNSDGVSWTMNKRPSSISNASNTRGFTLNPNAMTVPRTSYQDEPTERIYTSFSKRRRVRSQQKMTVPSEDTYSQASVNLPELRSKVTQAHMFKKRVVNVIQLVHQGIRWKLNSCFVQISTDIDPLHTRQALISIRRGLHYTFRQMYLFHLNRQPLPNLHQLHRKQYSVFVHRMPKIEISVEVYFYLSQQIKVLEGALKQAERDLGVFHEEDLVVVGEVMDVQGLVDKMIDDPEQEMQVAGGRHMPVDRELAVVNGWYEKGMKELCENSKNKNFQQLKSSIDEKSDTKALKIARSRLQQFQLISNPHKYKMQPISLLLQTVRQQRPPKQFKSRLQRNIESISHSQKSIYQQLYKKNTELFKQNIPFIMEKYNISRADAHDLYTLYKCLEQISAMRLTKKVDEVMGNGIDRRTFYQGLAGLGFNIADQVIKNICYFDDFINWPEFLKIVSISASKTPEEKLNAILNYVKDSQSEYLTKLQVDILVTTSLSKFLGKPHESGFADMKEYFMNMIFEQLDPKKEGRIKVDDLKDRILRTKNTDDLISFVFLASQ